MLDRIDLGWQLVHSAHLSLQPASLCIRLQQAMVLPSAAGHPTSAFAVESGRAQSHDLVCIPRRPEQPASCARQRGSISCTEAVDGGRIDAVMTMSVAALRAFDG